MTEKFTPSDTEPHPSSPPAAPRLRFEVKPRPFDLVRRLHAASAWALIVMGVPVFFAVASLTSMVFEPTSAHLTRAITSVLALWAGLGLAIYVKYPTTRIEVEGRTLRVDEVSRRTEYDLSAAQSWRRVGNDRVVWFSETAAVWIPARSTKPSSRRALDERLPPDARRPDRTSLLAHATITVFVPALLLAGFLVLYDAMTRSDESSQSSRFRAPPSARQERSLARR